MFSKQVPNGHSDSQDSRQRDLSSRFRLREVLVVRPNGEPCYKFWRCTADEESSPLGLWVLPNSRHQACFRHISRRAGCGTGKVYAQSFSPLFRSMYLHNCDCVRCYALVAPLKPFSNVYIEGIICGFAYIAFALEVSLQPALPPPRGPETTDPRLVVRVQEKVQHSK